jgi:hypothetical protein
MKPITAYRIITDEFTPRAELVEYLKAFARGSRELIREFLATGRVGLYALLLANIAQMCDVADELRNMRGMSPRATKGETL